MILYGVTIVSSAFLLFLVQPIIAKQILPWFGGTAAVWTVCLVFFQTVLLAGYAYAHVLARRSARTQAIVHGVLLLACVATLPILASPTWKPSGDTEPIARIAAMLAATVGLPYFALSSTGPLIQRWVADDASLLGSKSRVYRLFAWSNIGSLVGLLIYPFAVEPNVGLSGQAWTWSAAFVAFALACGACGWRVHRRASTTTGAALASIVERDEGPAEPRPTLARSAYWLVCSALGSMLLLALTNHMTQNVASIPFLWILPLTLYLASFVIVFEGRAGRGWYVSRWWLAPSMAAVILATWALSANHGILAFAIALPVHCAGLFFACVFCHGELARTKPAPAWLTQFYLCLAAGGALGGLFVALVAPNLFANYYETPLALFATAILACGALRDRTRAGSIAGAVLAVIACVAILLVGNSDNFETLRELVPAVQPGWTAAALIAVAATCFAIATWRRWPLAIVATAVGCVGFFAFKDYRLLSRDTVVASRNFYGALRVKEIGVGTTAERRNLLHGVIVHGDQYRNEDRRYKPTTYYGPTSGIAVALRRLRADDEPIDVAMIGLGAGTLTAWGRTGDRYRIYDIDPAVVDIARRDFTYLADSRARHDIVLGDARLSMERELADRGAPLFDVIAVDAFSSDAIPVHLITREALAVYFRRLKPDGIVAFHVSNRFLKLAPVVQQLAQDAGAGAVDIVDDDPASDAAVSSEWTLVTRNRAFLADDAVRKASTPIKPIVGLPLWTDQFNNLFKIIK